MTPSWISARHAPLILHHVRAHADNQHNDSADSLAKKGATLPVPLPHSPEDYLAVPPPPPYSCLPCSNISKVSSSLPERVPALLQEPSTPAQPTSHRGRSHKRLLQTEIRTRLQKSAQDGSGPFWRFYNTLRSGSSPTPRVSLTQLTSTFIPRMNPPDPSSSSFDLRLLTANDLLAQIIPWPSGPSTHPAFNAPIHV
ncbi:hypothetical protein EV361DRAFT_853841, partial [Lentinula raphanica]